MANKQQQTKPEENAENNKGQVIDPSIPKAEEIGFEYVDILNDNEISLTDLPMEIRKKINFLKATLGRYAKTPSKSILSNLTKLDYEITNIIADYIEKDLPSEDEYNQKVKDGKVEETPPPPPPVEDTEEQKAEKDATEKEAKVLAVIGAKGLIETHELISIIGHNPSDRVKLNKTTLKKVFLRNEYVKL